MAKYSRLGKRHPEISPAISKDQISTLKQKAMRVEDLDSRNRVTVWDLVCDLWTQVIYSFKPKSNQCRIYGHTLPSGGWVAGKRPNCGDCGAQINNADELRRAVPRDSVD